MKSITISPTIYSNDIRKDGRIPIKVRITFGKKSANISIGKYVLEKELVPVKSSCINCNRSIRDPEKRRMVEDYVRNLEDSAEKLPIALLQDCTPSYIFKLLLKASKPDIFKLNFVSFCQDFILEKKKSSPQAALNYQAGLYHLCEFIRYGTIESNAENKKKMKEAKGKKAKELEKQRQELRRISITSMTVDISIITSTMMRQYESALARTFGKDARAISLYTSCIAAMHKKARLEYNNEELDDLPIKNPFEYYKPPKQPDSKHKNIPKEIIQGMINNYQSLSGRKRFAIGSFLLSFGLMGTNVPDLFECNILAGTSDVIEYDRVKTRERRSDRAHMEIKVHKVIMPLFNEFLNSDMGQLHETAFYFSSHYSSVGTMQDSIRKGLSQYETMYEIKEHFTFYSARHSWATIARSSECKISLNAIGECLNHVAGNPIDEKYAVKDYSIFWETNEKVLSTLDWEPLLKK